MKKIIKQYPLLLIFAAFVIAAAVANLITPDKEKSEMENRFLSKFPVLSVRSLLETRDEQKFTYKFEQWVNDQFVGRDLWIALKSLSETTLGKIENNGIIYGDKGYMFENYPATDMERIEKNMGYVRKFYELYHDKTHITFGVVPSAYAALPEYLPVGLKNVDQKAVTEQMYSQLPPEMEKWALFSLFADLPTEQREKYFYRTDHHWTTNGAFYVYQNFVKQRGKTAPEAVDVPSHEITDFYGTHFNKCKLVTAKPDTITYYDIPFTSFEIDGEKKDSLYDAQKWAERDKYGAFIWSNNGLSIIKSDNNLSKQPGKTSRILLVKDSFSNCLAPFFTYSYDEVYIVDLRFLVEKMSELMERTDFDDVLILYNFMSISSDKDVMRLAT